MKTTVKATLGTPNAKKHARQENTPLSFCGSLVAKGDDGELCEAVTVRCYFNPRGSGMQPVRASIWVTPFDRSQPWRTGRGDAGGCGYHKESAAIADAVSNAGFELWGDPYFRINGDKTRPDMKKAFHFGGTGSSAYPEIFKAIARAMGYRGRMAWVHH